MCVTSVGIDPGFTGAVGCINDNGVSVFDLPVVKIKRLQQFDLAALNNLIYRLTLYGMYGSIEVGLENPTTRPGEGAERCKRFGEGIGMLKGLLTAHQLPYVCVPPNLWKARLGLPGKDIPGANQAGAQFLISHHPKAENLIYGPRGGLKDGRLDALLIAHAVRMGVME